MAVNPIPCTEGKHLYDAGGQCTRCNLVVGEARLAMAEIVRRWIEVERGIYASVKFGDNDAGELIRQALASNDTRTVLNFPFNYLKRVEQFGLDTPQGLQALGKALVTLLDYLDTLVAMGVSLPAPGYPSGEIVDWPMP